MKTFFTTLMITFALALSTNAQASKLDALAKDVHCFEQAEESWTPEAVLGFSARILPEPVTFFGKTDITAVFPNGQQTIVAAAMHLDEGDETRKHGHAAWKWMSKHYGEPIVTNDSWLWFPNDSDIKMVNISILRTGTAVLVECR